MNHTKDINFIDKASKASYGNTKSISLLFFAIILLGGLLAVSYFWVHQRIDSLKTQHAKLDAETADLLLRSKTSISTVQTSLLAQNQINDKKNALTEIKNDRLIVSDTIKKLLELIPQNVYISSLTVSQGADITVDFLSPGPIETLKIILKFNQSGWFEEIPIENLSTEKKEKTLSLKLSLKQKKRESATQQNKSQAALGGAQNGVGVVPPMYSPPGGPGMIPATAGPSEGGGMIPATAGPPGGPGMMPTTASPPGGPGMIPTTASPPGGPGMIPTTASPSTANSGVNP